MTHPASNVLALDTSTDVLAISATRSDAWASIALREGLQHSPSLIPLVDSLLARLGLEASTLDLVVCSVGPGSFTGIRIGLATSLGIARARGTPLVGISTLDALAEPWQWHRGEVYPVIDARKGKIYTALFTAGARQSDYLDVTPAELGERLSVATDPLLVGPDATRIRTIIGKGADRVRCAELLDPGALVRLGKAKFEKEGADPIPLRPLYLRKSEAEIASGK
ncbi:MAG TPA: tRNA (adenosine(37)-N6)-threonylcarbamoyltransferase complex dimerization subunit type 1 TsaB [Spirochaetia bacterium]|nr:tRNA (adenosine(37)-N6)-threonylcarbamoyltransferase complex dimerization subunit type 1 TsaB [Spirochaetia bacterium]